MKKIQRRIVYAMVLTAVISVTAALVIASIVVTTRIEDTIAKRFA